MIHDTLLNNYGTFSFTTTNPRGTKNATADFLLGLPATMNQDAPTTKINNGWYFALYRAGRFPRHPRLTLNLGVRWDIQTADHRSARPLPHLRARACNRRSCQSAPLGLLFPGDPGVARGIITTNYNHFSPRVGFAWDPFGDRKTAIRGAAGIFYGSMSGNEWNTLVGQSAVRHPPAVQRCLFAFRSLQAAARRRRRRSPTATRRRRRASSPRRPSSGSALDYKSAVHLPDELRDPTADYARHQPDGRLRQQPDPPHSGDPGRRTIPS